MTLPASRSAPALDLGAIRNGAVVQKDSLRGWAVVGASFVGMLLSVGVLVVYSFGVLTSAMAADFGWGNIQRSGVFVSFSLCATVAGPVWGAIADRVGARRVAIISSVLLAAGFGVLAMIPNSLLGAHLAFAAIGLLGSGTLPAAYASLVVGWFDRRRGLALGLAMVGVGVGTAVMPPLGAEIISRHGWRSMCVAYSLMILVISIPFAALFLRAHPAHHVPGAGASRAIRATLAAALTQYRTWILAVFAFSTGAVLIANVTNFVPLLQSRGESLTHAALFQSVLGVSLILGRLIGGALLDRVFAPRVVTVILLCTALGFLVLREANSSAAYIAAACGVGLAIGLEIDFLAYIVSRYYDRAAFTTIFALLFAIYSLGAAIGPPLFAWLVQFSAGYGPALLVSSFGMFVLGLLMFALPHYEARESTTAAEGA